MNRTIEELRAYGLDLVYKGQVLPQFTSVQSLLINLSIETSDMVSDYSDWLNNDSLGGVYLAATHQSQLSFYIGQLQDAIQEIVIEYLGMGDMHKQNIFFICSNLQCTFNN